jgi:hypothetical protein
MKSGHVTRSSFFDYTETEPGIEQNGRIGLQVHVPREPVEMRFKDLWIKVSACQRPARGVLPSWTTGVRS